MIQLTYEPAFDPFHTAFRILRQAEAKEGQPVRVERMKILDVYMAEPQRCTTIRVPPRLRKAANMAATCQRPLYGRRPAIQAFFNRMSPMQDAAIQTLVLHGLLDAGEFQEGRALRSDAPLDAKLYERVRLANKDQYQLTSFLFEDLDSIALDGIGGLKDRTGLGEYRYDIV